MIGIIVAVILGILAGCITGVLPGIHINMVSMLIVSLSAYLFGISSEIAVISFIVAMAVTHTFIDFIPSIFLGAPDEDSFLAVLPGHELLNEGRGYEAAVYTAYGGLTAIAVILIFTPLFILFLPAVYKSAEIIMPYILILASVFLVYFEKSKKLLALIIFSLSGLLGLATLNLPVKESLFPLFTGLFGASSLITSLSKKQKLPKQEITPLREIKISKTSYQKSVFASLLASPLCSFLPGLGSGQAAVIGSEVIGNFDRKEFLVLLGAINTIVMGMSFVTLYCINKARTGVAVAVRELITLNSKELAVIVSVIVISGIAAFFLSLVFAGIFSKIVNSINYSVLSAVIIALLVNLAILFSGFLGVLILAVSTCLGLACIYLGVRRTHLMGCLLVPAIVLYLL